MPEPDHGFIEIELPFLAVALGRPSYQWIDVLLPAITNDFSSIVRNFEVDLNVPLLTASFHALTSASGNIAIVLGWPQLANPLEVNFQTGSQIAMTLPALSYGDPALSYGAIHVLTSTLIHIAAVLPKPSMMVNEIGENFGWVDIELPSLTGTTHVIATNQGQISGAIPLPQFLGTFKTGTIGHLAVELPFIYYDSILLPSGIIAMDVTLPCVIITASGRSESAAIGFRTIVMNTINFGVTEYGDIELKGMTDVFGKVIAINRNDLVQIGATLDDQSHIDATLHTGTLDFSDKFFVKPRDVWVTLRSGKKMQLTIKDNEVPTNESTYSSENFVENLKKTRFKVGRGFAAEFFDMKFENIDGELVDITNIHVLSEPMIGKKR